MGPTLWARDCSSYKAQGVLVGVHGSCAYFDPSAFMSPYEFLGCNLFLVISDVKLRGKETSFHDLAAN